MKQPIFSLTSKNIFKTFLTTVFVATILFVAQIYSSFHQHHHNQNFDSGSFFDNLPYKNHNSSPIDNKNDHANCLICNISQFFKIAINNDIITYFFSLILLNFTLKKYYLIFNNYCISKQFSRAPPKPY